MPELPDPEDEATTILGNVGKYLTVNKTLCVRRRINDSIVIYNTSLEGNHKGAV